MQPIIGPCRTPPPIATAPRVWRVLGVCAALCLLPFIGLYGAESPLDEGTLGRQALASAERAGIDLQQQGIFETPEFYLVVLEISNPGQRLARERTVAQASELLMQHLLAKRFPEEAQRLGEHWPRVSGQIPTRLDGTAATIPVDRHRLVWALQRPANASAEVLQVGTQASGESLLAVLRHRPWEQEPELAESSLLLAENLNLYLRRQALLALYARAGILEEQERQRQTDAAVKDEAESREAPEQKEESPAIDPVKGPWPQLQALEHLRGAHHRSALALYARAQLALGSQVEAEHALTIRLAYDDLPQSWLGIAISAGLDDDRSGNVMAPRDTLQAMGLAGGTVDKDTPTAWLQAGVRELGHERPVLALIAARRALALSNEPRIREAALRLLHACTHHLDLPHTLKLLSQLAP